MVIKIGFFVLCSVIGVSPDVTRDTPCDGVPVFRSNTVGAAWAVGSDTWEGETVLRRIKYSQGTQWENHFAPTAKEEFAASPAAMINLVQVARIRFCET